MMIWNYVGGGAWELQRGLLLGCVYGRKLDDKCSIAVEIVAKNDGTNYAPRGQTVQQIFKMEDLDCPIDWAKMLVEAYVENVLRDELAFLKRILN